MADQTGNTRPKRKRNGQFPKGNKEGNRFKPGESPNPKGRPKSLTTILRELLTQTDPDDEQTRTRGELLMLAAYEHAANGKSQYFVEIMARIDGKASEAETAGRIVKLTAGQVLNDDGGEK